MTNADRTASAATTKIGGCLPSTESAPDVPSAATPWFSVGQTVIVSGGGVGKIIEVGELRDGSPDGYRGYRINYGGTKCHTCNRPSGDRIEWTIVMHVSLTVSERKRLEAATA